MRGLKFRAWDKDGVEYVDGVGKLYVDILEVGTKVFRIEQMCPGRYILEQYTGLKDKNGKEIYEGDILDVSSVFVKPKKMVVEFSEMACGFEPFVNGCSDCYFPVGKDVEVIGNIHENPELIKEKE